MLAPHGAPPFGCRARAEQLVDRIAARGEMEVELEGFLVLLIVAGVETTANLIAKSMLVLTNTPALAAALPSCA